MKIVGTETLFQGWGLYERVTVERPDGSRIAREVEHHGDATAVLVYDPGRRVALLVKQLRVPMLVAGGVVATLEVAAGRIDEGEDGAACVRREAMEELGVRLSGLEHVVFIQTMPGISTERMHLFLAPYGNEDRIGPGGGLASEEEDIEIVEMPLAELAAMADRGELLDSKTMLLLQTLRLRQPDLFGPSKDSASV